ncbi:MAG: type IV pilus biogenesis protein PilM [Planctomycetota bacterium]|jgi:Tfp pilus assembly PilM family ATPase
MPRCTGIQISGRNLRAVELRGSAKNPLLLHCAEMTLPKGEEGGVDVGAALRQLLDQNRMSRDPAVLAHPALSLKIRSLTVPFQDEDQIDKVVRTLMEEHLHGLPIEEALVVHHKVRDLDSTSSRVLSLAVAREDLAVALEGLQARGVDPQAVEPDLGALYNFGSYIGAYPEAGWTVHVDLDADRSAVLVVRDGALQSFRAFRMNLESREAPEEEEGNAPDGEGSAPAEKTVKKLSREILRTLMAESLGEAPVAAFVSGPLSNAEALRTALREETGLPLEPLPLPEALADLPDWGPTPFGAALKFFGRDRLHFDFRQDALVFKRKFERVSTGLVVLAVMTFLFFSVLGYHFDRLKDREKDGHRKLADQAVAYYRQALQHERLPPRLALKEATAHVLGTLKKKMNDLTGAGMDKDVKQIQSVLSLWRDLAIRIRSARSDIQYLTLKEIHLSPRQMSLKGEVDSPRSVDMVLDLIRTDPRFGKVEQGSAPKLNKQETAFSFHIRGEIRKVEGP